MIVLKIILFSTCSINCFVKLELILYHFVILNDTDLRHDKQFFIDHPGAVPITTAQVIFLL